MRLLTWNSQNEIVLIKASNNAIPPYAILSHTWGAENDEVTFDDLQLERAKGKLGYRKIQFCSEQAQRDQIEYFWIDTCCINKADSTELSEAINSMYKWYRDAEKCYVYLSDVSPDPNSDSNHNISRWDSSLRTSRWFTRGWTLQELLAPKVVEFFSFDGVFIGTKRTLSGQICEITTIPLAALYGTSPMQFPIAERWRWAERRQTTRNEDKAYCLLGIFEVFMPLIYGEGDHAFLRLEKEVEQRSRANVKAPMNSDLMYKVVDPNLRSVEMPHLLPHEGHAERTSKQCRPDQIKSDDTQSHRDDVQEGRINHMDNYENLLKSLLFDRIDFRVNNVKKPLLSTCEWLLSHPCFQTWYKNDDSHQHNGFLWIKGKPGCGKSTLMKVALEWVRKRGRQHGVTQTVIPYFFNARASASLEKSALGLYRTLVYHLLSSYDSLRSLFMEKFAFKNPSSTGEGWTAEELQEFLYDCVESHVQFGLCLFIDALDEAEYDDDVRQMISFLIQLSDRSVAAGNSCKLQICLSSRHYPHISIGRGLSLVVEEQFEHRRDIETYISKQLTCPDGPDKDVLRANVLNKSASIFLWVIMVVAMLNLLDDRGASLTDMQARLETIPAGLNNLFKDILLQSNHGIGTTVLFFQWMVFGIRPLEPAELFVAIEYSRSPADSAWVLPSPILPPPPDRLARYVLNCSHGLVEMVTVAGGQPPVVQFIHETVREFLTKDDGLVSVDPALATNLVGISHDIMRIACLRCVSANSIPQEYLNSNPSRKRSIRDMRVMLPFLDYAIMNLYEHAEQAQVHDISQREFMRTQMSGDGVWLGPHRQWWNVIEGYKSGEYHSDATLLYFLVEQQHYGLLPGLPSLLEAVNRIPKGCFSVLCLVSAQGHPWTAQLLLEAGADVEKPSLYDRSWILTPLYVASENGHEQVVKLLLEAGADIQKPSAYDRGWVFTPLYVASKLGHEKVVRVLLEAGVNVQKPSAYNCSWVLTPLYAASENGHEKVVKLLLEAGAEVNAGSGRMGNPLSMASLNGHEKVVQLLLQAGADINVGWAGYRNALELAVAFGNESVARLLWNAGARSGAERSIVE